MFSYQFLFEMKANSISIVLLLHVTSTSEIHGQYGIFPRNYLHRSPDMFNSRYSGCGGVSLMPVAGNIDPFPESTLADTGTPGAILTVF